MTTVVFLPHEVAADGLMTMGSHVINNTYHKIHETDHVVVGGAGHVGQLQKIIEWVLDGLPDTDCPRIPEDDHPSYEVAFIVKETGKIYIVEGRYLDVIEVHYPVCLGSGGLLAQGSILQQMKDRPIDNVSAREAILIAKAVDTATGGRIKVIKVKNKKSPKPPKE
jgi:ATP-dependent protease HslVU (ClpYQ) peptidase subunit